jgi:hypothetical protein
MVKELDMRCGTLSLPQLAVLGAYVLIVSGMNELGLADRPLLLMAIALTVAVTLVLTGRGCLQRSEEA